MSKRGDRELLNDIKESCKRIELYIKNATYENFLEDIKTQDAIVRNLEIIGEAAKNISGSLKEKYSKVLWKELAGVRNRLIHQYFGVNYDIVWDIIRNEVPEVVSQIEKILNKESGRNSG